MTAGVQVVEKPETGGKRRCVLLTEDRVGHYPEFRAFFVNTFDLDRVGLSAPGYLKGPSGHLYELCFLGRSGEGFPSGVEISVLVDALEPFDEGVVDRDLWEILRWVFSQVGAPWSVAELDGTGRLYRIPAMRE